MHKAAFPSCFSSQRSNTQNKQNVFLSVCVMQDSSKCNASVNLKLEHIIMYENS